MQSINIVVDRHYMYIFVSHSFHSRDSSAAGLCPPLDMFIFLKKYIWAYYTLLGALRWIDTKTKPNRMEYPKGKRIRVIIKHTHTHTHTTSTVPPHSSSFAVVVFFFFHVCVRERKRKERVCVTKYGPQFVIDSFRFVSFRFVSL